MSTNKVDNPTPKYGKYVGQAPFNICTTRYAENPFRIIIIVVRNMFSNEAWRLVAKIEKLVETIATKIGIQPHKIVSKSKF